MPETRVTSTEFGNRLGLYFQKALSEPVTITHHGRDSLVVMSAEEYKRLKRRDRQVYRAEDTPEEFIAALQKAEPPVETAQFNDEVPEGWDRHGRG
ncbi:MAG: type II toxin-antitoxin system prevent-host-death family antitoxin [Rhodomicrobium sp.]